MPERGSLPLAQLFATVMLEGRERKEREWRLLLARGGFIVDSVRFLGEGSMAILEARRFK